MNILLSTSCAIPSGGGIASYNEELVNLFGREHSLYLITASKEENVYGYKETVSYYGKDYKTFIYARDILDKIDKWKIDIVINSDCPLIAVLAPYIKVPIISISHFINGRLALSAGYNANYLSAIVSLSNYGKDYLIKTYNIKEESKVKVIYNFVADKEMPFPDNKINRTPLKIVYPGGTSIKKSFEVVMCALYKLLKTNLNFKFIWLGNTLLPSAKFSKHKDLRQFFEDDNRLEIKGKVSREEAIHYIEQANIFLLPSRGEGCPMTLLEAMRAGCIPIVSDAKHGSVEILQSGKFGKIVKQGSSTSLFDAIEDILVNHGNYINDYKNTFTYSRNMLSQNIWAQQMKNLFLTVRSHSKEYKILEEEDYALNWKNFDKRLKKERCKEQFDSLVCRLYLEYLYYFIK